MIIIIIGHRTLLSPLCHHFLFFSHVFPFLSLIFGCLECVILGPWGQPRSGTKSTQYPGPVILKTIVLQGETTANFQILLFQPI